MHKAVLAGPLLAGLIFTGSAGIAAADTVETQPAPAAPADAPRGPLYPGEVGVIPGSPGDENGNGVLDTTERPDAPQA